MPKLLNLTQTDIITRLRRFAGVVGGASPATTDQITLDATVANLAVDPYQGESIEWSITFTPTIAAGNFSFVGIQNGNIGNARGCPLICVDRVDFFSTTAMAFTLGLARPYTLSGTTLTGFPSLNRGWPYGSLPQAQATVQITNAAALPGGTLITTAAIPAATTVSYVFPYPVQLFPQQNSLANGDLFWVGAGTVDVNFQATFWWREFTSFKY